MLHKEFWGLLFLAFVVWVFIASDGSERINRVCKPIGWSGNLVVSLASLAAPDHAPAGQKWFDKFEYGCRYMTWRVIYQDEYNKYIAAQNGASAPAAASGASAVASGASK